MCDAPAHYRRRVAHCGGTAGSRYREGEDPVSLLRRRHPPFFAPPPALPPPALPPPKPPPPKPPPLPPKPPGAAAPPSVSWLAE
ncbi:hypothetical protein E6W39_20485 [Kitasatospora acidiphila]|uniref:Uncharacterized protein n=1 Tax=Kitasatospora acidiphila TaxID=2567942 RepID=A0A540W563_9ACTN|nr:hypothetical protein E6W39_20485 [Kitasatospora acidiphila]